jgi:hypothetical protein
MNRRRFLALLGSSAIAPALPVVPAPVAGGIVGSISVSGSTTVYGFFSAHWEREMLKHAQEAMIFGTSVRRIDKGDRITIRRPQVFEERA